MWPAPVQVKNPAKKNTGMTPAPVPACKPAWYEENLPDGLDFKKKVFIFLTGTETT